MERPWKRPRLSIFQKQTPDAELNQARYMNDLNLKSRFEAIFEKYSQDFTEIGDEIDVKTGEIVVNNGHLESMEGETDTGEYSAPVQGTQQVTGKSLLRAMTVAPEVEDTYTDNPISDEVITSIEAMAENAAGLVEDELSESEDDLFETTGSREVSDTPEIAYDDQNFLGTDLQPIIIYSSDEDSLLDGDTRRGYIGSPQSIRSKSPDSLFDVDPQSSGVFQAYRADTSGSSALMRPEVDPDMSAEAILDKFGPDVGNQVLGLLEHRSKRDSHLEPAWRIPVDIGPARSSEKFSSTPVIASSNERELSANHEVSLWGKQSQIKRPQKRRRKPVVQRVRTPDGYRDESEDPLQGEFSGTKSRPTKRLSESLQRDEVSDWDEKKDGKVSRQRGKVRGTKRLESVNSVEEVSASKETRQNARGDQRDRDDRDDESDQYQYDREENRGEEAIKCQRVLRSRFRVPVDVSEEEIDTADDDQQDDTLESVRKTCSATPDESQAEESDEDTPQPEDNGVCSFCNKQFANKSSVMAHWDRLVRKPASRTLANDPHDMELIRSARGLKSARVRGPRLTLGDFRTMVELHEGGGLSFAEIVDSQALRTHKMALQLQDVYDRHRTVPGTYHFEPDDIVPWTAEETECLQEHCQNRLVTMATLKRLLKGREEVDIGNKLADDWLRLLRRGSSRLPDEIEPGLKFDPDEDTIELISQQFGITHSSSPSSNGLVGTIVVVKEEE